MPPHDETARVGSAGSLRRPPPARASAAGAGAGAARRPAAAGRPRTTASRGEPRTPARSGGGGGGRPPAKPPTGGSRPGGGGKGRPPGGGKKRSLKQRRRRWAKVLVGAFLSMLVLLGVFVGVVYASTDVPTPESVQNQQTTIIYYADGVTEMARLGSENRINVSLDQVSEPARNAILAAENRNFYNDPGISFTGIVRAAWNNLTGGSTQGGSTITQQYVKNAFLSSDQTFSRKFKELFLAIKLDNEYSKDEILENYLNTIYFGRGAYGIEAAAETYFDVKASELTAEQSAVLAVLVRSPSYYDPASNPEESQDRWARVLDAMVDQGWYDPAVRAAAVYPAVAPDDGTSDLGTPAGPEGLIVDQVRAELQGPDFSYSKETVEAGGLRVTTTIDPSYQTAAVNSVNDVMQGEDEELREALVAIDPRTGGVKAYYGNKARSSEDPNADTTDYAQALKPPGSSFKPYTLAAALENGFAVTTRRDGTSPQEFDDRPGLPVVNSGNAQCGNCTIKEAITRSLNTTFYGLAYDVGPELVADLARDAAGIPDVWDANDTTVPQDLKNFESLSIPTTNSTGGSIGIGEYAVRPIQQAVGFATFASGGVYHQAHFVQQVADSTGAVLKTVDGSEHAEQVMSADVANDVSFALDGVASYSKRALDGNRPVASKTGTQGLNRTDNSDAWMVGYTPSLSTAVWMGKQGAAPIENAQGNIIYGSGLPGAIWQTFMNAVLEGTPEEPLPSKAVIKGNPGNSQAGETTQAPASTSSRAAETSARPTTSSAAPTTSTAPTTSAAPTTATTQEQQPTSRPTSAPSGPTCGFGNLPDCGQQGTGPPGDD